MVEIMVKTNTDDLHEGLKTDGRGRVTLGAEYANEAVSIAVVDRDDA